ncbi:MAG: DUF4348 domain-containing protein [Cyclobacteriaceae bacterium]
MKNIFWLIFLLLFSAACRSSRQAKSPEDFTQFYERFLTDSAFQMSRIDFPLPGLRPDESEDTAYQWTREEWIMLKKPELDSTYLRELEVSDTLATDEIYMESSGFYFKMVYEPIKRKWHLVYLIDSGL